MIEGLDVRDTTLIHAEILRVWHAVLGAEADPDVSFLANGGDSFRAVVLAVDLLDVGIEVDYLDVLQAGSAADLAELVGSGSA